MKLHLILLGQKLQRAKNIFSLTSFSKINKIEKAISITSALLDLNYTFSLHNFVSAVIFGFVNLFPYQSGNNKFESHSVTLSLSTFALYI